MRGLLSSSCWQTCNMHLYPPGVRVRVQPEQSVVESTESKLHTILPENVWHKKALDVRCYFVSLFSILVCMIDKITFSHLSVKIGHVYLFEHKIQPFTIYFILFNKIQSTDFRADLRPFQRTFSMHAKTSYVSLQCAKLCMMLHNRCEIDEMLQDDETKEDLAWTMSLELIFRILCDMVYAIYFLILFRQSQQVYFSNLLLHLYYAYRLF